MTLNKYFSGADRPTMIKSEEARIRIENIAQALCYLPKPHGVTSSPIAAEDVLAIRSAGSGVDIQTLSGKLKHNKGQHLVCIQYACIWALWNFTNLGFEMSPHIRCHHKTIHNALSYINGCTKHKDGVYTLVLEIIAGCMQKSRKRVEALYLQGEEVRVEAKQQEIRKLLKENPAQWCNSCPYFKDKRCPLGSTIGIVTDGFCPRLSPTPYEEHTKLMMPEKSLQSLSWAWIN